MWVFLTLVNQHFYHFTTLNPNLGVLDFDEGKGFVIADIPGLIEGASEGVGLGHEFLRHIERTKVLIHIVDAASTEGRDAVDDINKIKENVPEVEFFIEMNSKFYFGLQVQLLIQRV